MSACAWSGILVAVLFANDPAEGVPADAKVVDMLRETQVNNLTAYPKGSINAKVRWVLKGTGKRPVIPNRPASKPENTSMDIETEYDVSMIWDGDKTHWHYKSTSKIVTLDGKAHQSDSEVQLIETPGSLINYRHPSANGPGTLVRSNGKTTGYPEQLRLHPEKMWFTQLELVKFHWKDYFDDKRYPPERFDRVFRQQGEKVTLAFNNKAFPGSIELVFSLDAGGNVTSYRKIPGSPNDNLTYFGTYEWKQHPAGVWYPKRFHQQQKTKSADRENETNLTVEINDFSPSPSYLPNRFDEESLNVAPGTRIVESR